MSELRRHRAVVRDLLLSLVLFTVTFAVAMLCIELTRANGRIASVWLVNGVLVAALARSERKRWPAFVLASGAGMMAANLAIGDALLRALALTGCNLVESLVVAWILGEQCRLQRDALRDHFRAGQVAELTSIAHSLKGAAGSVGADALTVAAERLEQARHATERKAALDALLAALEATGAAIEQRRLAQFRDTA